MARKKEYDWLDDPFKDKKTNTQVFGMKKSTKVALTIVFIVVLLILIGLIFLTGFGMVQVLGS
ncbi:MAG: hypothetical protein ACOYCA_01065 [Eggerthellaceae bacterium]|jgi:hypothetical protein